MNANMSRHVAPAPLEVGGVAAEVLYRLCVGEQAIIVKSPPGGGKSTLMAAVAAHVAVHLGVRVTIACQSHHQAAAMAIKLLDQMPPETIWLRRASGKTKASSEHPLLLDEVDEPMIEVRTLASLATETARMKHDPDVVLDRGIVLIDEAYQASFAVGVAAISPFSQVVLVGDPGQIGPVVTARVEPFRGSQRPPHRSFAAVMENDSRSTVLDIHSTYRLGARSAAIVAPFYDFAFDSRRDKTWIEVGGRALSEVHAYRTSSGDDASVAASVVDQVRWALSGVLHTEHSATAMSQGDIAVVAAVNITTTLVAAALGAAGYGDVAVGTADSLQGGEWAYVIALDPLMCVNTSDHHLAPGRLCVMLSRHRAHLTFVHDGRWADKIDGEFAELHRTVRMRLGAANRTEA